MDSILKFVQGHYIQHFENNIKLTIMVYLQRQRNPPQQEKFIQILKTWEVLGIFHANTLREIRQTLNFNTWVEETATRCITPEYLSKIDNLRRTLNPIYLPIEMAYQNKFKFGSDLNQIELR